jgi:hypothetical protein
MKKHFLILMIFFLILQGCSSDSQKQNNISEDDFTVILSSDKNTYKNNDDVIITAKLKYTGEKDKITIFHGESPFYFSIKETTTDTFIPTFTRSPLLKKVLIRNEWYEEIYDKSNATTITSDNIDTIKKLEGINNEFIAKFLEGKTFPPGNYLITLETEFDTEINGIINEYKFLDSIEIVVED